MCALRGSCVSLQRSPSEMRVFSLSCLKLFFRAGGERRSTAKPIRALSYCCSVEFLLVMDSRCYGVYIAPLVEVLHMLTHALPFSIASASFLKTSALNCRNALSMRCREAESELICRRAENDPDKTPSSPPINSPPKPKKVYAAISPILDGRISDVTSGSGSTFASLDQCLAFLHSQPTR